MLKTKLQALLVARLGFLAAPRVAKRHEALGKCAPTCARSISRARARARASERATERAVERVSEWMDGRADQGFGTVAN